MAEIISNPLVVSGLTGGLILVAALIYTEIQESKKNTDQ
jgi:hypothetical protein